MPVRSAVIDVDHDLRVGRVAAAQDRPAGVAEERGLREVMPLARPKVRREGAVGEREQVVIERDVEPRRTGVSGAICKTVQRGPRQRHLQGGDGAVGDAREGQAAVEQQLHRRKPLAHGGEVIVQGAALVGKTIGRNVVHASDQTGGVKRAAIEHVGVAGGEAGEDQIAVDDVVHVGDAGRDFGDLGGDGDPEALVNEIALRISPRRRFADHVVQRRQALDHEVGAVRRRVAPAGAGAVGDRIGRCRLGVVPPAIRVHRIVPRELPVSAGQEREQLDRFFRIAFVASREISASESDGARPAAVDGRPGRDPRRVGDFRVVLGVAASIALDAQPFLAINLEMAGAAFGTRDRHADDQ